LGKAGISACKYAKQGTQPDLLVSINHFFAQALGGGVWVSLGFRNTNTVPTTTISTNTAPPRIGSSNELSINSA
jgi:hypothetical protein